MLHAHVHAWEREWGGGGGGTTGEPPMKKVRSGSVREAAGRQVGTSRVWRPGDIGSATQPYPSSLKRSHCGARDKGRTSSNAARWEQRLAAARPCNRHVLATHVLPMTQGWAAGRTATPEQPALHEDAVTLQ
jgi:hypothetical protein